MQENLEIWKETSFSKMYLVSNLGRIKSLYTNKILKPCKTNRGYLKVTIRSLKKNFYIHTEVANAFIGPRPYSLVINHIDGNTENNKVSNLEYITQRDNLLYAIRVLNKNCKIPRKDIPNILKMLSMGIKQKEVAELYNVDKTTISFIKRNNPNIGTISSED